MVGPIATGLIAAAPAILRAGGAAMSGLADLRAAQQVNMPAQNALEMERRMLEQHSNGGLFDPNGQYQQAMEQRGVRQAVQAANMDNRQANEALKRGYVMNTYRNAQDMGMRAIDTYLQGNNQAILNRANIALAYQ
jgi:hypothetical protein